MVPDLCPRKVFTFDCWKETKNGITVTRLIYHRLPKAVIRIGLLFLGSVFNLNCSEQFVQRIGPL
jgi:hypothetical protein